MFKKKRIILIILGILLIVGIIFLVGNSKGQLLELKSGDVIDKIKNKESFVLCISQTTCTHCMTYKPKLKRIADKYNIDIYYIDIDLFSEKENEKFSKYIYSKSTPTTIFIINGKEKTTASRLSGDVKEEKVINKLKKFNFID